jgi:protein TonB
MPDHSRAELYSANDIARAAGVAEERVQQVLGPAGRLVSHEDAVRIGRSLIATAPSVSYDSSAIFTIFSSARPSTSRRGLPLALSGSAHALVFVVGMLIATFGLRPATATLASEERAEPTRLVFMVAPGPGGGGGGGGRLQTPPPPKAEREGRQILSSPLPQRRPPPSVTPEPPKPEPPPPPVKAEPLPPIVAPIVTVSADKQDRPGVLEDTKSPDDSHGAGTGGGAGKGKGTGLGEGDGAGVGPGSGGGTGGGPFRPGSGVEAPRLLSEVKPDYTDDARRRGIEGEVVMEIIVRSDGSVGDVKVLQGLPAGLNERAVQAVRRWRFAPARMRGTPVDVIVEASVEFRMR